MIPVQSRAAPLVQAELHRFRTPVVRLILTRRHGFPSGLVASTACNLVEVRRCGFAKPRGCDFRDAGSSKNHLEARLVDLMVRIAARLLSTTGVTMGAEEAHERGREGVENVKRWLESTLRFEVPFTVYTQPARVTVALLNDDSHRYDMVATHFRDDLNHSPTGCEIWIEVKNVGTVSTARKQVQQFREFVATAYSASQAEWVHIGRDPLWEFMFATTYPWEVEHYLELTTPAFVEEACGSHRELLGDHELNRDHISLLAERLWIWIVPIRQDEMTMGMEHVGLVWRAIKGGGA